VVRTSWIGFMLMASATVTAQTWSGLDPNHVPLAKQPIYSATTHGWQSLLDGEDGRIRVRVHDSEGSAKEQYKQLISDGSSLRPLDVGQAGSSNGWDRAVVLTGNIVLEVQRDAGEVDDLAARLVQGLEPATPWPTAPQLQVVQSRAWVDGMWAQVRMSLPVGWSSSEGASVARDAVPITDRTFAVPADTSRVRATVWDRYGRAVSVLWTAPESDDQASSDEGPTDL
jgi:hypothetical protein